MKTDSDSLINADHAAFMQGGVSISMSSCDANHIPSVVRAAGCHVAPDRQTVTILVMVSQAGNLLDDIRRGGAVSVTFSKPSTYRTMQLKGRDAVVTALSDGELDIAKKYRDAFVQEVGTLGHSANLIYTIFTCEPGDIVAVRFTPCAAFSQTPGPRAGESLKDNA